MFYFIAVGFSVFRSLLLLLSFEEFIFKYYHFLAIKLKPLFAPEEAVCLLGLRALCGGEEGVGQFTQNPVRTTSAFWMEITFPSAVGYN